MLGGVNKEYEGIFEKAFRNSLTFNQPLRNNETVFTTLRKIRVRTKTSLVD